MTGEEREQYLVLKKLAQKEERAEQARIRRAAQKWIEEKWGMSVKQLDKVVVMYRDNIKRKHLAAQQQRLEGTPVQRPVQPAAQESTPKGAEGSGTSTGCIGRNTSVQELEKRDDYE